MTSDRVKDLHELRLCRYPPRGGAGGHGRLRVAPVDYLEQLRCAARFRSTPRSREYEESDSALKSDQAPTGPLRAGVFRPLVIVTRKPEVTTDPSRVAIVVVARMTSSRLPGKSLLTLAGDTVLGRVLTRTRQSQEADCLIVATSSHPTDDPIAEWCLDRQVPCFRGPLSSVAQRVFEAAQAVKATGFVRVSADSPFIDTTLIDHAIRLFRHQEVDLVTNVFPRTFPKGESVEIISTDVLGGLLLDGLTPDQQEHVTKAFYDSPDRFSIISFTAADVGSLAQGDHSLVQLSIDTEGDLITAVEVSELIGGSLDSASWLDVERAWRRVVGGQM